MNTAPLLPALLVAALALAPCGARAAATAGKPPAAAPAPEAPPPRSVFTIDPQFGRDPFFPSTKRFTRVAVQTNVVASTSSSFPEDIRIQGYSNHRGKPLVILNGKSIEKGEKIEVNIRIGRVAVRCLELTDKSILLECNGQTKELPLPVATPVTPQ